MVAPIARVLFAVLASMLIAAGCSSSDDPAASASGDGEAASTTVDSASGAVVDNTMPFEPPEGRLDAVEAAELTFEEIDYPTQPAGVPWPTGQWPTGELPDAVDAAEIDDIVDTAFGDLTDADGSIDAIIVVKDGELVVEEYNDWDPAKVHNSWSMAKSINSSLVGILVGQGELDVEASAEAPEWSEPGDPRAAITIDQLLRMSSGLEWEESYTDATGDVVATLGTDKDRGGYAAAKPLAHEPDAQWYYSSGTANLLARTVAEQVGYGDEFTGWIDEVLFDKLGITTAVHSLDSVGVISGGSFIDMSPTDFARFGLLYARDGIWDGERILPEGWVDYSRMPTPNNGEGTYGAQWWLDPNRPATFYASGYNGQSMTVAPREDLVVVVLSTAGDGRDDAIKDGLLDAFGA